MRRFVLSALPVVAAVAATLAGAPGPARPEADPRGPRAERPVTATPEYARAVELRNRGRWAEGAAILDDLARKTTDPRERMQLSLLAAQFRVSQSDHDASRLALRPGTLPLGHVEATRQLARAIAAADPALGPEIYAIGAARLGERLAVEDRTQQTLGRKAEVLAAFDGAIAAGQGSDLPPPRARGPGPVSASPREIRSATTASATRTRRCCSGQSPPTGRSKPRSAPPAPARWTRHSQ